MAPLRRLLTSLLTSTTMWHDHDHFHCHDHPHTDDTHPVGENVLGGYTTEFLGHQWSSNSCSYRDLGFTCQLRGKWYAVYGDTLWCAPGVTDPKKNPDGFHGMVRNSLSALTENPLVVYDLHLNEDYPVPHQTQLVPFNPHWGENNTYGFGGTGIAEVDACSGTGVLYYLVVSCTPLTLEGRPQGAIC